MHALRDRLLTYEAIHLGSELPMLIRGLYYEGFAPTNPSRKDDLEEFLTAISNELRNAVTTISPKQAAQAVLTLLQNHISQGEMSDVLRLLPAKIRIQNR